MIPRSAVLRLHLVCMQILTLLVIAPGELSAIQIEPNPNPSGNTITITPSVSDENLVPFTNRGLINIEPLASFQNSSQFNNGSQNLPPSGADIRNSGTIINSGQFNNISGVFSLDKGSRFNNLPSGIYSGLSASIGIGGTFVNEGTVTHSLGYIVVGETGQYIQRQAVGSSVTPITITPDAPFRNSGRLHIAAGDFNVDPISVRAASATFEQTSTGTTHIDARLQNIGGTVVNAGAITVGAAGEYRQQSSTPAPFMPGSTTNTGTFTNAGTTNIVTGTFTNQGSVANSGTFTVGTAGTYNQTSTSEGRTSTTTNSGTFTNAGQVRIGEGTSFGNFPRVEHGTPPAVGGQYIQLAGGTTRIDGTFSNGGGRVTNEGAITVGTTGIFHQTRSAAPVPATPAIVNNGNFTNAGSTVINAGAFTNPGSVANSGTFQIGIVGVGTFDNRGSVVNSGQFEVGSVGGVSGTGSYVQTAAAAHTIVNGTFGNTINLQAGSLSGTGTITGAVTNTGGVVQPGTSLVPGTLTLANYTQGNYGRLDLKLGGLLAGSQYDVLKITGQGTLGGSLSVRLLNGFTPGLGNTFNLLACSLGCAGLNGGSLFSGGLSLPSLASGLAWLSGLTDGGNGFSLTVVAAAASAPEPGTLLLIASGFLGLVMWRRRQSPIMHGDQ